MTDIRTTVLARPYQLLLLDRVQEPGQPGHGLWGYSHEHFCIWRNVMPPRTRAVATTYFAASAISRIHRLADRSVPDCFKTEVKDGLNALLKTELTFRYAAFAKYTYEALNLDVPEKLRTIKLPVTFEDHESWHVGAIAAGLKETARCEPQLCLSLLEQLRRELAPSDRVSVKIGLHSWLGARHLVQGLCQEHELPPLPDHIMRQTAAPADVALRCGIVASHESKSGWADLIAADSDYDGYRNLRFFSSFAAHLLLRLDLTAEDAARIVDTGTQILEHTPQPHRLLVSRELSSALGRRAARDAHRSGHLAVSRTVLVVGNHSQPMGAHARDATAEAWKRFRNIRPRFETDNGFARSPNFQGKLLEALADETENVSAIISVQPSQDARALRDFLHAHNVPSLLFLVVASRDDLLDRQPLRNASQSPVRVIRLPNNRVQARKISEVVGNAAKVLIVLENIVDGYVKDLAHSLNQICPSEDSRFEYVTLIGTQFTTVKPTRTDRDQVPGWSPTYASTSSPTHLDGYTVVYIGYPRGLRHLVTLWNETRPQKVIASDGCAGARFDHDVTVTRIQSRIREEVGQLVEALDHVDGDAIAERLAPSHLGGKVMDYLQREHPDRFVFVGNENTSAAYQEETLERTTPPSRGGGKRPYLDWAFIAQYNTENVPDSDWTKELRAAYENVATLLENTSRGETPRAEKVVLFHNTTAALQRLLISLTRASGDQSPGSVLTTDIEYAGTLFALRDNWRDRVFVVPIADLLIQSGPFPIDELRNRFSKAFTLVKPRLILLSHVDRVTGFVMPITTIVRDLERLAPSRSSFHVAVDGAQGVGNANMQDLADKIDFYVGCTHKWLGSEPTLGFLYSAGPRYDMRDPAQSYYLGATTGGAGNLRALHSFNERYKEWWAHDAPVPADEGASTSVITALKSAFSKPADGQVAQHHSAGVEEPTAESRGKVIEIVGDEWDRGDDDANYDAEARRDRQASYRSSIITLRSADDKRMDILYKRLSEKGYETTHIVEHPFYEFSPDWPKEFLVLHFAGDSIEPVPLSEGFVDPHPAGGYLRLCVHPKSPPCASEIDELIEYLTE